MTQLVDTIINTLRAMFSGPVGGLIKSVFTWCFTTVTFLELLKLLLGLVRRRRVKLIIAGPEGSGKTSVYCRLRFPEINRHQLGEAIRSAKTNREWGELNELEYNRLRIFPECLVLSQNDALQVEEYLSRSGLLEIFRFNHLKNRIIPETVIWLVVLAPVRGERMENVAPYLELQKGYLALITAFIKARKRFPCNLVLLCMNKADLFLKNDPNSAGDGVVDNNLERGFRERFKYHRAILQEACRESGLAYNETMCSTLKPWGFGNINGQIRNAVTRRRAATS